MILKWKSAGGEVLEFTDKNKYLLKKWSGFGYPPNKLKSVKSPYQIGSTPIGQIIKPRNIIIEFTVITDDKDLLFQREREVIEVINPLQGAGKLIYEKSPENIFKIEATPIETPQFMNDKVTYEDVKLNLRAFDPRWYNPEVNIITLNQSNNIYNAGDTRTPIRITLEGPMSNPLLINKSSGKKIELNHTIESGEKIEIDTKFGSKIIELYDSFGRKRKAFSLLTFDSQLFELNTENNLIEFRASNINEQSKAVISYRERYLGI